MVDNMHPVEPISTDALGLEHIEALRRIEKRYPRLDYFQQKRREQKPKDPGPGSPKLPPLPLDSFEYQHEHTSD